MNKYLIEVSGSSYKLTSMRAAYIYNRTGSHFVTHADWGFEDGQYKAWFVAETENEKEALALHSINAVALRVLVVPTSHLA